MLILDTFHRLMRRRLQFGGALSSMRVVAGRRLHHYDLPGRGPGPTVVLVHGLGGSANSFAGVLFGLRAAYRRIVVVDLPGHGFSPLDAGETPLDVRGHFVLLKAFLDAVVPGPITVVGNSMGGALAIELAIERPENTLAVGLLSPAGAPLGDDGLSWVRQGFATKSNKDALTLIERMLHRPPRGAWLVASDFRQAFNTPIIHHVLTNATSTESSDIVKMRALTMPISFVWGASDRLLPMSGYEFFRAHLPPHARIELFAECGHLPQIEQPRRTIALLSDLARAVGAPVVVAPMSGDVRDGVGH